MIATFMLEHPALMPVVMALIAVICVIAGYLLVRARYSHQILWTLAGLSLLPVVVMTLNPTAGRSFVFCVVQFSMPSPRAVELLANVALFLPLVYFATLATRKPLLVLASGTFLSAGIEVVQGLIPAIGRSCDTNDWAMNTAGAVIAVLLASATITVTKRRQRELTSKPLNDH
ncbi:VanZ family protein [Actinophytocola oryzae]|uniref:VanZ like protein n=1 Tax=Actinophytocola oryzae TaxID=502181 RepID=A0A4R7UUG4_9PSEU|nr:VanZ family protein [Actinophytocola oryzae]TDV38727.1 VanZ like protein [Actinophytocola oryzae]